MRRGRGGEGLSRAGCAAIAGLVLAVAGGGCAPEQVVYLRAGATPSQVQGDLEQCSQWADQRARGQARDFAQREAMYGQQGARAIQLDSYERFYRDNRRRCMVDRGYQDQVVSAGATAPPASGQ